MENENKDLRGYDLRADNFKTQLLNIINSSNLPSFAVMYILKDTLNEVEKIYNNAVNEQYRQFCEQTKEEEDNINNSSEKDEKGE